MSYRPRLLYRDTSAWASYSKSYSENSTVTAETSDERELHGQHMVQGEGERRDRGKLSFCYKLRFYNSISLKDRNFFAINP